VRSTGTCLTCGYPVRIATTTGTDRILLAVYAESLGNVWIKRWGPADVPVVVVERTHRQVPHTEAFKYKVHACIKRAKK
jgi:hypothetical protein